MLIAGKADNDDTVLELWSMVYPPLPAPAYDVSTGTLVEPGYQAQVGRKAIVYQAAVVGRDIAMHLMPVGGRPDSAYLMFHDSRDLYEFDVKLKTLTKVLTPVNDGSAGYAPELTKDWNAVQFGLHQTHGYVYFLDSNSETAIEHSFAMLDTDVDGTLDTWYQFADVDQWDKQGFADVSNYTWLVP